ncbi:MAG: FAD-dependent monooxygenase [Undibacterium sp.]|nr:FAD-dependent monooxygenase [Undibacterium sp.]
MGACLLDSDVCIVGDGAVGKAAALGFSQAGLRVTLLAAAHAPVALPLSDWDVRVFALNHVAQGLLDRLKVWDALDQARVAPVSAMRVMDAGASFAANEGTLNFDAYSAYVNDLAWIVEDANLTQALDSALRFAPNVTRVVGVAKRFELDADTATIHLANGDSLRAALVVGADGAQSWLRGQCDIGLDYRSYQQQGVVSNFACEKPHHGVAYQWFLEGLGAIALLPLPGNRVSLVWSAPDDLATELMSETLVRLAERLAVVAQPVLGELTPIVPHVIKAFPLRFMRPHSMIAPRVALVGDAAHVVHPLAGHGMNLGFADVNALLACVTEREAHRDCGDARVLRRFQRARREEVALMQMATDGLFRLFASDLPAVRLVRSLGLNLLDRLPLLKRKLIAQALGR